MFTDHEVYRNGWHLIKVHGTAAHQEALRISADLARKGEQAAADMWARVAGAVEEITSSIPSMSKH